MGNIKKYAFCPSIKVATRGNSSGYALQQLCTHAYKAQCLLVHLEFLMTKHLRH